MSNPEQGIFQAAENQETLKTIEIPEQEMECLHAIKDFVDTLSEKEYDDFDGPIGYPLGTKQKIEDLLKEKIAEIEKRDGPLTQDNKLSTYLEERAKAQYEICRDVLEYQKDQLAKLCEFIEKQNIWKSKFTTASNVIFQLYSDNPVEDFKALLAQSEELHAERSFAQQNRNSLYYVSNAGASLRIKTDVMYGEGSIRNALQKPMETILYVDDITDHENYRALLNTVLPPTAIKGTSFYPKKYISFEPKIACQVDEYATKDFREHSSGKFTSKINISKNNESIIVKGYEISHGGHYINKIFFSK